MGYPTSEIMEYILSFHFLAHVSVDGRINCLDYAASRNFHAIVEIESSINTAYLDFNGWLITFYSVMQYGIFKDNSKICSHLI